MGRKLEVGTVYRYPRALRPEQPVIDGLPNYFHRTATPGLPAVKLDRGISAPAAVDAPDGRRTPVICLRTSPDKAGSWDTPWQDDYFEDTPDLGYYGDNRIDKTTLLPKHGDPAESPGNATLLDALPAHKSTSPGARLVATPVMYFRGTRVEDATTGEIRVKGNVRFEGLAVLTGSRPLTETDPRTGRSFPNLVFRIRLLRSAADIDWRWIDLLRNPTVTFDQCETAAPPAWRHWIERGL